MPGSKEAGARRAKLETERERLARRIKEQVVQELGLWDKVLAGGWGGLSAKESGRIGGVVARRLREGGMTAADGSPPPLRAVLRTKDGCSLCGRAERILERIARDVPLQWRVERLDSGSRDAQRVPILLFGDEELQSGKISEWRLRNWLRERGYLDATR